MDIKILDNDISNSIVIRKKVLKAVEDLSVNVTITIITDLKDLKKYNIKKYPSIIINNIIIIEGEEVNIKKINRILKREEKILE